MKRGPGRREGEAPPGSWNSGVQVPGRARGDVSAFRVMAHLPHVWVPSPSKALPSSRPGVWGSGLCSLLGPGREDRRPGPPPRDHHHRCLLHRHRPGERSTRPGGRGLWGWGLLGGGACRSRMSDPWGSRGVSSATFGGHTTPTLRTGLPLCFIGWSSPQEPFRFCKSF